VLTAQTREQQRAYSTNKGTTTCLQHKQQLLNELCFKFLYVQKHSLIYNERLQVEYSTTKMYF